MHFCKTLIYYITVIIKPGKPVGGEVKTVDKKHVARKLFLFKDAKSKSVE